MKSIDMKNGVISYYGNPVGYVKNGIAIVDPMFKNNELAAYLTEEQRLDMEWTNGVYDRLASGAENAPDRNTAPLKSCRIWQLKPDTDIMIRFIGYDDLIKGGHGEPDPANYQKIYDGQSDTSDPEEIYARFKIDLPHGFEGHPLSISDVIELHDENGSEFHYVDTIEFKKINFGRQEPEQENA